LGNEGTRRWLLNPGDELNNTYKIDEALGYGGMGEVYLGHSLALAEDVVAIKVILPERASVEEFRKLFDREAGILLRLRHPSVVGYRSFSHDKERDLRYIVTDFVDGVGLEEKIKKGPLNAADFATLAKALMSGLQAVHDENVVHRDLSPDNIILADGKLSRPKIIDFGVVKDTQSALTTIVGDNLVGKMQFMAPEQLGKPDYPIGPWTDVYALGLVLLAAYRGEVADMGGSFADAIDKRQKPVDLSGVDPRTANLIRRMTATHPEDRCRSMGEALALLSAPGGAPAAGVATIDDPSDETIFVPRGGNIDAPDAQDKAATNNEQTEDSHAAGGLDMVIAKVLGGVSLIVLILIIFSTLIVSAEEADTVDDPYDSAPVDGYNDEQMSEEEEFLDPSLEEESNPISEDGEDSELSGVTEIFEEQPEVVAEQEDQTHFDLVIRPFDTETAADAVANPPPPAPEANCDFGIYRVYFEFDESQLTSSARAILDGVVSDYANCGQEPIFMTGHDARRIESNGEELVSRRLAATQAYLTARGVPASRLSRGRYRDPRTAGQVFISIGLFRMASDD
jgi:serine/threonine protein kinase/outer membrane protein OmpA-like peptidoglycan-associated protein